MTIIRQGDSDQAFYVLENGSVEVIKDGVVLDVLDNPGTIFGEISGILNKPRTTTVNARTQSTVTKYEALDLHKLIQNHPDIAVSMLEVLAQRLDHTTQKLIDSL